ncbi:hypothetical protein E2320_022909, partial [Naja naja]
PACKKPKRGDEEPPTTDTWNGSVSNELDMSETQTADENVPSEDFDRLNTPEEPSVYLESVQAWQRNLQHYRATEYYERYRFVNMEYVQSFTRAIDIIHNEVQRLLNCISGEISPNDFVQLRLDAEELAEELESRSQEEEEHGIKKENRKKEVGKRKNNRRRKRQEYKETQGLIEDKDNYTNRQMKEEI